MPVYNSWCFSLQFWKDDVNDFLKDITKQTIIINHKNNYYLIKYDQVNTI